MCDMAATSPLIICDTASIAPLDEPFRNLSQKTQEVFQRGKLCKTGACDFSMCHV